MGPSPLGFLAILSYQQIWYVFINYCLSQASHAIPLSMMSCRRLMLDLKVNIFLYPQPSEASDVSRRVTKLKLKFCILFLLQYLHHASRCNQRLISLMLIDRDVIQQRKKAFLSVDLDRTFGQRCSINLIGRRVLSRIVFLPEFAIDWH